MPTSSTDSALLLCGGDSMTNNLGRDARIGQVDCIVYLPDRQGLPALSRTAFSLYGQLHRPLRMIVVADAASGTAVQQVRMDLAPLLDLPEPFTLSICLHRGTGAACQRDGAFNTGLAHAEGQYVILMDTGELLYPEACSRLVERLSASGAAMAFSAVRCMNVGNPPHFRPRIECPDLDRARSGTIRLSASCMINRACVPHDALLLDTSLPPSVRDSDLTLRVGALAPIDFQASHLCFADRHFSDSSDAAMQAASQPLSVERAAWALARLQADTLLLNHSMQHLDRCG